MYRNVNSSTEVQWLPTNSSRVLDNTTVQCFNELKHLCILFNHIEDESSKYCLKIVLLEWSNSKTLQSSTLFQFFTKIKLSTEIAIFPLLFAQYFTEKSLVFFLCFLFKQTPAQYMLRLSDGSSGFMLQFVIVFPISISRILMKSHLLFR